MGIFDTKRARGTFLAIIAAAVLVAGVAGDAVARSKVEPKVRRARVQLAQQLNALDFDDPRLLLTPSSALPVVSGGRRRSARIGHDEVQVTVEVSALWQERCLRGTRYRGR